MPATDALLTPFSPLSTRPHDPPRSPRWPHARAAFFSLSPRCAACPASPAPLPRSLNVHHVLPFHLVVALGRPDLELDPRNLLTLCEAGPNHHLLLGHLDDWSSYNPHVRIDVTRPDVRQRPRRDVEKLAWWLAERAARPPHTSRLSPADRARLRATIDVAFPLARFPQPSRSLPKIVSPLSSVRRSRH